MYCTMVCRVCIPYKWHMIDAAFVFTETQWLQFLTDRDGNASIQTTFSVISLDFKVPILLYCGGLTLSICLHSFDEIVENALLT